MKTLLFLLGLTAAGAHASDWAYLSGNENHALYIDLASIRLSGSLESAWFGQEFRPAQADDPNERPHTGFRNKIEVDCAKNLIRSDLLYFYDAAGNVISAATTPTAWAELIPDSTGDQMITALCRTKRAELGKNRIKGNTPDKFQDFMYEQKSAKHDTSQTGDD